MRILYTFGYHLNHFGGHVIHALKFCSALINLGHQVRLVAPIEPREKQAGELPSWVYPVQQSKGTFNLAIEFRRSIAAEAARWKPDVFYVRAAMKDIIAIHWIVQNRFPLFLELNSLTFREHLKSSRVLKAYLADRIENWEMKHSTGILCITREIARIAKVRTKNQIPLCVTGNGFDPAEIHLAPFNKDVRAQMNTPIDVPVIIFTGSLQPWQGLNRLLPVMKELDQVYLWIIGDGEEKEEIQNLAEHLGISNRLRWLRWVGSENLFNYLATADLAIGPLALERKQMTEAQPMKVRTYLGAGLPVLIGYHDTRIPKALPWAKTVDPNSPTVLKEAVQELLALPTRSASLRQEIRNFAVENLSWDKIAVETVNFMKSSLS